MTAKVIELNAPAYLVVAIDDALAMLRAGDKSAAVELLAEALEVAQRPGPLVSGHAGCPGHATRGPGLV
jgi:hypothetical protein